MVDVQNIIDRQLGFHCRFNYDNILKRLVVDNEESFYGLQSNNVIVNYEHDPPIFACRFSEASGYEHVVALANEDGRVAIQNTAVGQSRALERFQCHNNAVFDLAWMPQHRSFVTVSGDHTAVLWDVSESAPKRVRVYSNHTRSVKTAAFRPMQPSVFATGARDGHILVWDTRDYNPPLVLKPENCLMNCHSNSAPKTPSSHSKRPRIDGNRAISITGLVFQDEQTLISCGECDGNIKVWDLRKNYSIYTRQPLPTHCIRYRGSSTKNGYTNLVIDDSGNRLYASCMDNVIYCFNIATYNPLPEHWYTGHDNSTFYIKTSLSPDSMYLVSGSSDAHAYIWNVKYSNPIVKLAGHWAEVTCAAWCQKDDIKIVTCGDDAGHKVWRIGREFLVDEYELKGRAEVILHTDVPNLPQWDVLDRNQNGLKRKGITTPGSNSSKRRKHLDTFGIKKSKRCLSNSLDASTLGENTELAPKRLKLDTTTEGVKLLPAGAKRRHENEPDTPSPKKVLVESNSIECTNNPIPGSSFMTPTKNYQYDHCTVLSPSSPKTTSPLQSTPTKVIKAFIESLPNYVLTGVAPHLPVLAPVKTKEHKTDWLTLMGQQKKHKDSELVEKPDVTEPSRSIKNAPPRNSTLEKKSKLPVKNNLLNYFCILEKKKG